VSTDQGLEADAVTVPVRWDSWLSVMMPGMRSSSSVEPPDALAQWLAERFGDPVHPAEPSASVGDGFDSAIWLVRYAGASLPGAWRMPLVLRVKADAERAGEAQREADVQAWAADRGYPAPRVLAVMDPGELLDLPAQVMERAPGPMLLDHLRRRPWQTGRRLGQLAELQARLHLLRTDGFPAGDDLLERRLRLSRVVAPQLGDPAMARALEQVEGLGDRLRDAPPSVCHGDFHPLNVLVDREEAAVIDWTDAGVGDRHGDVARTLVLFDMASVAATKPLERRALGVVGPRLSHAYRRRYQRWLELDDGRLRLWTPVHLLHGWVQAAALHAGLLGGDGGPDGRTERLPPAMVGELQRRFEEAWAKLDAG
jgi:aminoglycoside phosphotransferase (APT) family kinase protein